jgi:phosphoribosylaminoimidazole-succinocarboxamide synthase
MNKGINKETVITIINSNQFAKQTTLLVKMLGNFGIKAQVSDKNCQKSICNYIDMNELVPDSGNDPDMHIENIISNMHILFDELPILVEGESKIVKKLGSKVVLEKFKPTVYSFSKNRYGVVEGTEEIRAQFTAAVFRDMNLENQRNGNTKLKNAFLGKIDCDSGTIIAQRRLEPGNLEVRVKRYHVGSPVHRYRYTDKYPTVTKNSKPLKKWDRFDKPIVCFDWRNPLKDDDGIRLADEPISDDYAAIWCSDVENAKKLASDTFLWLENFFSNAGLTLIDICFFIDQSGKYVFGEISPDCMRVREGETNPRLMESLDKDLWRKGEKEDSLRKSYERLYKLIFNN